MDFVNNMFSNWDYILLMFLRVSALIFASPIFGRRNIPLMARIGYCAVIAYMFFITIPQAQPINYNDDILIFILLCIKEMLFGLVLAYVLNLFFAIAFTAGQMIDMQMSFGMVNVFDPGSNASVPITGNFLNIVMLIVFFAVNGHHRMIEMLYLTVEKIPIGDVYFNPDIAWVAVQLFVQSFVLAISVSLPIIASGLMGEVLLGIIVRAVPQLNVFVIGLPLKVILGFIMLMIIMPIYVTFCSQIFDKMYLGLDNMFGALAGG